MRSDEFASWLCPAGSGSPGTLACSVPMPTPSFGRDPGGPQTSERASPAWSLSALRVGWRLPLATRAARQSVPGDKRSRRRPCPSNMRRERAGRSKRVANVGDGCAAHRVGAGQPPRDARPLPRGRRPWPATTRRAGDNHTNRVTPAHPPGLNSAAQCLRPQPRRQASSVRLAGLSPTSRSISPRPAAHGTLRRLPSMSPWTRPSYPTWLARIEILRRPPSPTRSSSARLRVPARWPSCRIHLHPKLFTSSVH